jgi:hypothetical protein
MAPTRAMRAAAQRLVPRPGLWAHTNNVSVMPFLHQRPAADHRPLHRLVTNVFNYHRRLSDAWATPEALLIFGGGFSFGGERAWMNAEAFPCDGRAAARALSLMLPGERVLAPAPGDTLVMKEGKLVEVTTDPGFVAARPETAWPSRGHARALTWMEDFGPASGRRDFAAADLAALTAELRGFAAFLYASFPFRRLYSLRAADVQGRKPTLALWLRAAGGAHVLEYQPQSCAFVPVTSSDPTAEYVAVYECWASDLLALFRAEIASPSLALARCRHYAAGAELFDLDLYLMQYAHPLRHPERFLALYRRVVAGLGPAAPSIPAAS